MALSIKNAEVERLAVEVAELTGESKTEAIRNALELRKAGLASAVKVSKRERWVEFLESEIWSDMSANQLGRRLRKAEEEAALGFGAHGL